MEETLILLNFLIKTSSIMLAVLPLECLLPILQSQKTTVDFNILLQLIYFVY